MTKRKDTDQDLTYIYFVGKDWIRNKMYVVDDAHKCILHVEKT